MPDAIDGIDGLFNAIEKGAKVLRATWREQRTVNRDHVKVLRSMCNEVLEKDPNRGDDKSEPPAPSGGM